MSINNQENVTCTMKGSEINNQDLGVTEYELAEMTLNKLRRLVYGSGYGDEAIRSLMNLRRKLKTRYYTREYRGNNTKYANIKLNDLKRKREELKLIKQSLQMEIDLYRQSTQLEDCYNNLKM